MIMEKLYRVILLSLLMANAGSAFAQHKLNFGIKTAQSTDEWPKSKAPLPHTERNEYKKIPSVLEPTKDGNLLLTKGWEMIEGYKLIENGFPLWDTSQTAGWYNAVVPGTVLTTLVEQKVYADPYYGLNNLLIPDTLCRMDWWYRIRFDSPRDMENTDYRLLMNGINYKAEIWLNGKKLGNMQGAFKRGTFDLKGLLKKGSNILAVHILPPNNPGIPFEENKGWFGPNGGALCLDGPTFISSEGWDWIPGIRDRNIGIWQDVQLVKTGKVWMKDPHVITDLPLPDTTFANIAIKTLLVNTTSSTQEITLKGQIEDIRFSQKVKLNPNEEKEIAFTSKEFTQLRIQNPRLWWPNGYGPQHLYNLNLTVVQNNLPTQTQNIRFGIRELSYELMAQATDKKNIRLQYSPTDIKNKKEPLFDYKQRIRLENTPYTHILIPALTQNAYDQIIPQPEQTDNPFLTILVNGKKIFCRGGNWGMDDGMKRVTRERLEPYFRLHQEANFTMVRNWTGESTEELFYTLCDEYGLLIWNDFSISTEGYNLEPLDNNLFAANAEDIVRRFRNHPSIAIWCPRNEGYAPDLLEDRFQQIILQEDGTRHYHANSRDINLCSSGPWHYLENSLEHLTRIADGFSTELGSPSVPTAATLKKFIPEEDLWPIGDVWYYHDLHYESFDWKHYIRDIDKLGKQPAQNADEFCTRAQFINYNTYRNMFETWNQKMWNNASGLLLWMSHPAWPSMIWQTYSYDYETHGSFYGSKKACEPLHIQWNAVNNKVQVINTTLKSVAKAKAAFTVYNTQGKRVYSKEETISVPANSPVGCFEASVPAGINDFSLVRVRLTDTKGSVLSENDYWINPSDIHDYSPVGNLSGATVQVRESLHKKTENARYIRAVIKNTSGAIAVGIKLNARNKATNEIVLPAYASEGYFNLLPGEQKTVTIEIPLSGNKDNVYVSADGLNLNQQL